MRFRYLLFLLAFVSIFLLIDKSVLAQQKPDSISINDTTSIPASADSITLDSIQRATDSLLMLQKKKSIRDTTSFKKFMTHPYLPMQTKPSFRINELRIASSFDGRFYLIIGMLFFLAFIKVTFPKYFSNLFQGDANTPVAYQMMEGLQPGINFTWNLIAQKKLTKFLDLNLSYFGRKSETSRTIHSGTVQLKAYF